MCKINAFLKSLVAVERERERERACSSGYLAYNKISESDIRTQVLYSVFCVSNKCK